MRLRVLALTFVIACCAQDAAPSEPRVASAQLPPGSPSPWGTSARWERDAYRPGQHLCFEVRGERFQLSVWPEGARNPALVRGRYDVARARGSDAAVSVLTLHVEVRVGATLLPGERLRLCRARTCGEMLAVTSRDLDE